MSIIEILYKTGIRLVCCIVQMFGVLIEGVEALFGKFGEYLNRLCTMLLDTAEKKKTIKKTYANLPLKGE